MKRSKIPILSRFDAISHIMPYYAQTHRAFLMLSSLCSETRNKLDEFYDEFVTCMRENWRYLERCLAYFKAHIFFPNDLFKTLIDLRDKKSISTFIEFIENLRDSKGWYFNSHYMHSKIKIRDPIFINIDDIRTLYIHVDVLKSTQVILCKKNTQSSKIEYESSTLDTNSNHTFHIKRSYTNAQYF